MSKDKSREKSKDKSKDKSAEKRAKEEKKARKALERIEETLESLSDDVRVLRERIDGLSRSSDEMSTDEVIAFLDEYRAGEALAEAAFGAWISVSDTACLRGGLRAVQQREGYHARLFEERIKELGGSPRAEVEEKVETFFMSLGDEERSDAEKVDAFIKAAGDTKIFDVIEKKIARMSADEETQALLRAVIDDERASIALLQQAHELLCGDGD